MTQPIEATCANCARRIRLIDPDKEWAVWVHPDPCDSDGSRMHTVCDWHKGMAPTMRCATPRTEPRRMIAVTVALSEPADVPEPDWADTIGANLRTIYRDTTVQIIDTWRTA